MKRFSRLRRVHSRGGYGIMNPALRLCLRSHYVPHHFCPFPERFGQPYETRLFLPDDVAGGRCRRSGAHGTGRRLRRYALGVRCTFRRLCSGVVLCPPHDAAEKLMPLSFTESIYKRSAELFSVSRHHESSALLWLFQL